MLHTLLQYLSIYPELKGKSVSDDKLSQTAPPEVACEGTCTQCYTPHTSQVYTWPHHYLYPHPYPGTPTGSVERLARLSEQTTTEDLSPRTIQKEKGTL